MKTVDLLNLVHFNDKRRKRVLNKTRNMNYASQSATVESFCQYTAHTQEPQLLPKRKATGPTKAER